MSANGESGGVKWGYIQKRYAHKPKLRYQILWLMFARQCGEIYNPMRTGRPVGERHHRFSITWETLCTDSTADMIKSIGRKPAIERDDTVSYQDGKPIGWNIKQCSH